MMDKTFPEMSYAERDAYLAEWLVKRSKLDERLAQCYHCWHTDDWEEEMIVLCPNCYSEAYPND